LPRRSPGGGSPNGSISTGQPEAGSQHGVDSGLATTIDVATACLVAANKFVVLVPAQKAVTQEGGRWQVKVADSREGLPAQLHVVTDGDGAWSVEFSTAGLGMPLRPGRYAAAAAGGEPANPGSAQLSLAGYGQSYGGVGDFEVLEMDAVPARE